MDRWLDILEVSQKQAFIFKSKKLKDNINNSELIAHITSPEYFEEVAGDLFFTEKNLVYSGGGHIILVFDDESTAKAFNKRVTKKVHDDYPDIELFVATNKYDANMNPGDNIKALTRKLEFKKSVREASFHQGSFGIEKMDATIRDIEKNAPKYERYIDDEKFLPKGYRFPEAFEELGGTKSESNFIAIVHVDGNGMGKRVEEFNKENEGKSWDEFREKISRFSRGIADDFEDAFKQLVIRIAKNCPSEIQEKLKTNVLPIRRIITSGDDICFVTEGRIGIECARIYIEELIKKHNQADGKGYAACAGVAIVHQKYPFFRAYELAEELCSHAKRFAATLDVKNNGASISAIDWHISFGELENGIEEVRKGYVTKDGKQLEMRPYIIKAPEEYNHMEPIRQYKHFKDVLHILTRKGEDAYARSVIKNLRTELKNGKTSVERYISFHKLGQLVRKSSNLVLEKEGIDNIGRGMVESGEIFLKTADEKERSILFDAIEIMDTFLMMD